MLAGWLAGWLASWLAGWLAGLLANWLSILNRVLNRVDALVQGWAQQPSQKVREALYLVGLCAMEMPHYDIRNDIFATEITSIVLGRDYSAHSFGVRAYSNGSKRPVEEFPEYTMRRVMGTIDVATVILRRAVSVDVRRDLDILFEELSRHVGYFESAYALTSDMLKRPGQAPVNAQWAMDACQGLHRMKSRFAAKNAAKELLDLFGTWMQTEVPLQALPTITFDDCTLVVHHQAIGADKFRQVPKKRENKC